MSSSAGRVCEDARALLLDNTGREISAAKVRHLGASHRHGITTFGDERGPMMQLFTANHP
jgi:hypothetical protein